VLKIEDTDGDGQWSTQASNHSEISITFPAVFNMSSKQESPHIAGMHPRMKLAEAS